jgi:hypothetical protein
VPHLHCREYNIGCTEDDRELPFIDPADALYDKPSCLLLLSIALHMKQLQVLTVMA